MIADMINAATRDATNTRVRHAGAVSQAFSSPRSTRRTNQGLKLAKTIHIKTQIIRNAAMPPPTNIPEPQLDLVAQGLGAHTGAHTGAGGHAGAHTGTGAAQDEPAGK